MAFDFDRTIVNIISPLNTKVNTTIFSEKY